MFVSRDPFARQETHKQRMYVGPTQTCTWCGGINATKTGRAYLYEFRTETDGGRRSTLKGLFCSKGCCESYHER
jgi:hypothetical protein